MTENQIDILIIDLSVVVISIVCIMLYRFFSRLHWRSRMRRNMSETVDRIEIENIDIKERLKTLEVIQNKIIKPRTKTSRTR